MMNVSVGLLVWFRRQKRLFVEGHDREKFAGSSITVSGKSQRRGRFRMKRFRLCGESVGGRRLQRGASKPPHSPCLRKIQSNKN